MPRKTKRKAVSQAQERQRIKYQLCGIAKHLAQLKDSSVLTEDEVLNLKLMLLRLRLQIENWRNDVTNKK